VWYATLMQVQARLSSYTIKHGLQFYIEFFSIAGSQVTLCPMRGLIRESA